MKRIVIIIATVASIPLLTGPSVKANSDTPPNRQDVIRSFELYVKGIQLKERDRVLRILSDGTDQPLHDSLRLMYPDYDATVRKIERADADNHLSALVSFHTHTSPYVRADAIYLTARRHVHQERFDQALPLLEQLARSPLRHLTLNHGYIRYFLGISQIRLLKRGEGKLNLLRFIANFPDAPERYRATARYLYNQVDTIQPGSLPDILDHARESHRRLSLGLVDDRTIEVQQQIISQLDTLIKEHHTSPRSSQSHQR